MAVTEKKGEAQKKKTSLGSTEWPQEDERPQGYMPRPTPMAQAGKEDISTHKQHPAHNSWMAGPWWGSSEGDSWMTSLGQCFWQL